MPRRKNVDGDAATNVKQPRVRKKKETPSICSTPSADGGMKLEPPLHQAMIGGGFPPGCGPGGGGGPMDGHHGIAPHMMHHLQHQGLPNGVSGGPQQLDEGPNGMGGPGFCNPQGPPFDFYQQGPPQGGGPPGMPPHFVPPMPMFGDGQPSGPPPQMMMQQPQSVQGPPVSSMGGPLPPGSSGQQFHPGQVQSPHFQMVPPMHPHHSGAPNQPGPISTPQGPPPQQMPPQPHQLPLPPHPMFPGPFPRMLFPPPSIPQPPFLEFRLQEMNRRLYSFHSQFQQATSESHEQWWDAFSQEFFDDLGSMAFYMQEYSAEQSGFLLKRFTISRHFIPRFFRSLFSNGINQLRFDLRSPAQEFVEPIRITPEAFGCCALNCENLLMGTSHEKPLQVQVQTECRLFIRFAPFNPACGYRIREWSIELRSCQEFYANGIQPMGDRKSTYFGLPLQTLTEMKMWQMMDQMQPIVERVKETNQTPKDALHQLVAERIEQETQRMAAVAASGSHTQTPPHNQNNANFISANGQPQMMGIMGGGAGMGPPQMPPPSMGAMQPPANTNASSSAEEPKPKPKRTRQRKSNAANSSMAAISGCATTPSSSMAANCSPPKGKKSMGSNSNLASAGQQTPPAGMPPMGPGGFPLGPPGQFHPLGGVPPPGQYHHDVLTVSEPMMMGCEYGEQDERQISRVENTAFSAMNLPPSTSGAGGMMLPPPGLSTASGVSIAMSSGGPMPGGHQQQILENSSLLSDFDIHSQQQQQQQQMNSTSGLWPPPPQTSSIDSAAASAGSDQWELKCAKV
uniref:LIM interaction domain-containing protein n=1 Tax=Meloidogyne incognita TaxID=6306 RepID=A0A914LYA8_MELIC